MKHNRKKIRFAAAAAFSAALIMSALCAFAAYGGDLPQDAGPAAEESSYLYTLDLLVTNPCEAGYEKKFSTLRFDFTYRSANGYGSRKTYSLDLTRDPETLKRTFVRADDSREYQTSLSLRIPGIVDQVDVLLNMDGGERVSFEVTGIFLNGFRVNADRDYVSSAYWDSEAAIVCHTPDAAIVGSAAGTARDQDQYGGLFTRENSDRAAEQAKHGEYRLFYHHECN